ncbi:MAG: hypothetical protein AAF799_19715 [Myxococcota bacterium]
MLSLDEPRELHRVLLYRDHGDPRRYYYCPAAPRIARDEGGRLALKLIVYRDALVAGSRASGGGFLDLTVDLGVPEETKQRIRDELSTGGAADVILAPLPLENGSVRIVTLGEQSGGDADGANTGRFVEKIIGSSRPALYGDNRATFSMQLSMAGASLMSAALTKSGATPVSVVYDLQFRGMMPAYRANITIDFEQTYRHLRNRFTSNTLVFKADLDREFESLMREEAIVIEQEDFVGMSPEDQATERTRLEQLARDLASGSMFSPSLKPGEAIAADRGTLTVYDPTEEATENTAGFTSPLTAAVMADTSDAVLSGTSEASGGLGGVAVAAPQPAPASEPEPAPAAGERPLTAVERWNQAGRPQAGYLLRQLDQSELRRVTYETKQASAVLRSIAPQGTLALLTRDTDTEGLVQFIDLADAFFSTVRGEVATSVEFGPLGIVSMVAKLRYGEQPDGSRPLHMTEVVLDGEGQGGAYEFATDHQRSREVELQVVLNLDTKVALGDPATSMRSEWRPLGSYFVHVSPREYFPMFLARVTVGLVDWDLVDRVECEVVYDAVAADSGMQTRRAVTIDAEHESAVVPIRPGPEGTDEWHVETTWHYADGTRNAVRSQPRHGAGLEILNGVPAGMARIDVQMVDPLDRHERVMVELRCQRGDVTLEEKFELSTAEPRAHWRVNRLDAGEEPVFHYRATSMFKDGTVAEGEWKETSQRMLLLGDLFAGLLDLEAIMLVDDFAAEGIVAARLTLEVPEAAAGFEAPVQHIWTAPQPDPVKIRVPLKTRGGTEYRYTVTWIRRDGATPVGPITTNNQALLLHPDFT